MEKTGEGSHFDFEQTSKYISFTKQEKPTKEITSIPSSLKIDHKKSEANSESESVPASVSPLDKTVLHGSFQGNASLKKENLKKPDDATQSQEPQLMLPPHSPGELEDSPTKLST